MYTEDRSTPNLDNLYSLHAVPGYDAFVSATAHIRPRSFLFDAQRFCHKAYAMLDAFESGGIVVWFDADVIFKAPITEELIRTWLDGKMCAYLGRIGSYAETGFLAFDTTHPDFPTYQDRFRQQYDLRHLFLNPFWIDCQAFEISANGLPGNNLSPTARGMGDAFSQSPLRDYAEHLKGARK